MSAKLIFLLIPLIVLQLTLQVVALRDLAKRKRVTGGSKWLWAAVILLGNMLGAAAYLLMGRKEAEGG